MLLLCAQDTKLQGLASTKQLSEKLTLEDIKYVYIKIIMCLDVLLIILLARAVHYYLEKLPVMPLCFHSGTLLALMPRQVYCSLLKRKEQALFSTSTFSRDIQCHIKENPKVEVVETADIEFKIPECNATISCHMLPCTIALSYISHLSSVSNL